MFEVPQAARRPLIAGSAAAVLSVLASLLMPASWREVVVAQTEDVIMRAASFLDPVETHGDIAVIDIDAASIRAQGPWPWPRERLAQLVAAAAAAKPSVLAVDMLLAMPDARSPLAEIDRRGIDLDPSVKAAISLAVPDGDELLTQALQSAPSVLGLVLSDVTEGAVPAAPILLRGSADLQPDWRGAGVIGPYSPLMGAVSGLGIVAMPADQDGIVRRLPLFVEASGLRYPGLALEALRVSRGASAFLVQGPPGTLLIGDLRVRLPDDAFLRLVPTRSRGAAIRHVPANDVLAGSVTFAPGSIILIGGSAPEMGGLRATHGDVLTPTVTLQARAITQLLAGTVPVTPSFAGYVVAASTVATSALAMWAACALGPVAGIVVVVGVLGALTGASLGAFASRDWLITPLLPGIALVATFAAASVASYVEGRRREARIRQRFEQHLAPQVVAMIVADPALIKLRGEKREITALFTDVENFTPMTERATPEDLIRALDEYFEGVAGIVIRHGGMVDKIVGDAVHAFFNAPLDQPDHAVQAYLAACEIERWTAAYRKQSVALDIGFGRTRIGLETGMAIVGDVGVRSKLDYTAHGIVVNSAARLEAANKEFGSSICLGPTIASRLPADALRPLGEIRLRGVSRAVDVFDPWPTGTSPEWRSRYLRALALRQSDPEEARTIFKGLAAEYPDDLVCAREADLRGAVGPRVS